MMQHLEINQTCSKDDWMLDTLETMVHLNRLVERRNHDLTRVQDILAKSLEDARKVVGDPHCVVAVDELERMLLLDQTVRGAERYISALTFDVNGYLERFWNEAFNGRYVKSNLNRWAPSFVTAYFLNIFETMIKLPSVSSRTTRNATNTSEPPSLTERRMYVWSTTALM